MFCLTLGRPQTRVSMTYSNFPQIFHRIKGTLQSHLPPWLRPFMLQFKVKVSHLYSAFPQIFHRIKDASQ